MLMKLLKKASSESGQGTVEYAIVAVVFIAIIIALGQLFKVASDGSFVRHAESSASHSLSARNAQGVVGDVLLY